MPPGPPAPRERLSALGGCSCVATAWTLHSLKWAASGWLARRGAGDEPCVPPLRHQDSLQGVRNEALLCSSQGQIFPIQAIMGGRPRARATQGHCLGRGPHMVVFSLGREKEKKKTGCKHKLYFLEKECAFPTCLFIYKPWEHWVPLLWGLWAAPGTAPCPCAPSLRHSGPSQLLYPVWGRRACLQSQMALAAQDCSSVWLYLSATRPLPPTPSLPSPVFSSFLLRYPDS